MEIIQVHTLDQAVEALRKHPGAQPLAGGTDLLVQHRQMPGQLGTLVDVSGLEGLKAVSIRHNQVSIGAALTAAQLEQTSLPPALDCLKQAAALLGGPQIRNRATVGGNLQTASPAGDLSVALLALKATVILSGAGGERELELSKFFIGVKRTAKRADEIILRVRIVLPQEGKSIFLKVGQRNALAISTVSLAAAQADGTYSVALGSVAPTPLWAVRTGACLTRGSSSARKEATALLKQEICPVDDVRASAAFRSTCASGLLEQALAELEVRSE